MAHNLTSDLIEKECPSPFIFEQVKTPFGKKPCHDDKNTYLLANTKPWANKHLPFPKEYKFEPCFALLRFESIAHKLREFKVRKDDVWVLAFPKSGTTWTENIVWQLKNGFDFSKEPIAFLGSHFFERDMVRPDYGEIENINNLPSPRIIKSHLPPHLLPVELWTVRPKIIYIARNPKDVAISRFHMISEGLKRFSGTIEELFDIFLENRILSAPFHAHILAYWHLRHLENFLFFHYEELLADQFDGIKKIAEFLECTYGEDELKQLTDYVSIGNMQKLYTKPRNNFQFFRRGKAGGFVDEMSEEYIKKFDEWTDAHFKDSDFKFAI